MDCVIKKICLLGDHAYLRGQRGQRHIPQVVTIDQNTTGSRVIKSGYKISEGSFARTAGADQRYQLTGFCAERNMVQYFFTCLIKGSY